MSARHLLMNSTAAPEDVARITGYRFSFLSRCVVFSLCLGACGLQLAEAQRKDALYQSPQFSVYSDRVVEGPYQARAISSEEIVSNYPVKDSSSGGRWKLDQDLSAYPHLESSYPLLDAVYQLSLSELKRNRRSDGAFDTGAKWGGVWTRDLSYSTILSLAAVDPEAVRASLLKKVKRDRIVQDTGTGGSWPVSSDRVLWSVAAWELYLSTGDKSWLRQSYQITKNSILDDENVVFDSITGLAHGETTFLDWREQTYPRWMQPADIYQSQALSTNAIYYRCYRILALMAGELGEPSADWNSKADRLRSAIQKNFWNGKTGYYGQYLYGRNFLSLSERADGIGNTLAILFDVAEPQQQDKILGAMPYLPYGLPTVFPQSPNLPPYHNQSIWPFVQDLWNLAAAKRENTAMLLQGMAGSYRAVALFLTNKENFVADTGSPDGTVINSDRQLWSIAGTLAMTYRTLFGMEFSPEGLRFHPVVPSPLSGTKKLTNFHYRNAVLSIEVRGSGSHIRQATMDGKPCLPEVKSDLNGSHQIVLEMENQRKEPKSIRTNVNQVVPDTPVPVLKGRALSWKSIPSASRYRVFRNGHYLREVTSPQVEFPDSEGSGEYQVAAVSATGEVSFLSEPVMSKEPELLVAASADDPRNGFIALQQSGKSGLELAAKVQEPAQYQISFRYANGSGPLHTGSECAIRTLYVDGKRIGVIVFPHRGEGQWENWGESSRLPVTLSQGEHQFELGMEPSDRNMNGEKNDVRIASLIGVKLSK